MENVVNGHITVANKAILTKFQEPITPLSELHPHWLTGFTDAEGYFHIAIRKKIDRYKLGW